MKASAISSKTSSPDSIFVSGGGFSKLPLKTKQKNPLTCVAKDVLGLSDNCLRNYLNLVFESEGNSDKYQKFQGDDWISYFRSLRENVTEFFSSFPSSVFEEICQVCMTWWF